MPLTVPAVLKNAPVEKVRAILEVLFYMARVDGVFSEEELAYFLRVAGPVSDNRITAAHLGTLVGEWAKNDENAIAARIVEISHMFDDSYEREMVCSLAAQLAEIDDAVLIPEQRMLDFLGRTFFPPL